MENRIEMSLLLDYYGELLTQKQKDIMTLYYDENLSLSEIADENENTRQAIHDLIQRTSSKLLKFEEKLHVKEDSEIREEKKLQLKKLLENTDICKNNSDILSLLDDI